jgi:hypothetical protein
VCKVEGAAHLDRLLGLDGDPLRLEGVIFVDDDLNGPTYDFARVVIDATLMRQYEADLRAGGKASKRTIDVAIVRAGHNARALLPRMLDARAREDD